MRRQKNELIWTFDSNGFAVLESVATDDDLAAVEQGLARVARRRAGTRNVLVEDWCGRLADSLKENPSVASLLREDSVAVQCTYFEKHAEKNWLVTLHRDCFIPVKACVDAEGWSRWSRKEGVDYVCPPVEVLRSLVALRLHLEDNTRANGPLQVVPGSHRTSATSGSRVECLVSRGGVVAMRPLLLHASSKLLEGSRRVLHFLYGPRRLPDGAEWAHAV